MDTFAWLETFWVNFPVINREGTRLYVSDLLF